MFVKLVVVACCVAVSLAAWHGPLAGGEPAARYPAGVSPEACPNFPLCDNPAVAANPSAPIHGAWNGGYAGAWNGANAGVWNGANAGAWNGAHAGAWNAAPAAQWNAGHDNGQWNGDHGAYNQNALNSGEYTGDGDYRGEGLAESGAFGDVSQQYNSPVHAAPAPIYNAAYAHHGHAAQVPAGVDPHSCPNYPFCH